MATCGKCHAPGVTVAHVRACYAQPVPATAGLRPSAQAQVARANAILRGDQAAPARRRGTNQPGGLDRVPNVPAPRPAGQQLMASNPWPEVDALRVQIKQHLLYKTRGAMVGRFALRDQAGVVKFYRVKLVTGGHYAGRVFVDAQASDDYHPVKAPGTLAHVLAEILINVPAAEQLYGKELGQCCRCGRTLTDETSRALGIGPDCRNKA